MSTDRRDRVLARLGQKVEAQREKMKQTLIAHQYDLNTRFYGADGACKPGSRIREEHQSLCRPEDPYAVATYRCSEDDILWFEIQDKKKKNHDFGIRCYLFAPVRFVDMVFPKVAQVTFDLCIYGKTLNPKPALNGKYAFEHKIDITYVYAQLSKFAVRKVAGERPHQKEDIPPLLFAPASMEHPSDKYYVWLVPLAVIGVMEPNQPLTPVNLREVTFTVEHVFFFIDLLRILEKEKSK